MHFLLITNSALRYVFVCHVPTDLLLLLHLRQHTHRIFEVGFVEQEIWSIGQDMIVWSGYRQTIWYNSDIVPHKLKNLL